MKTKKPLIDSADAIIARIKERNAKHLARWGKTNLTHRLVDVANLTFDGRMVRRNWELIDALTKDPRLRLTGGKSDKGVRGTVFYDVQITLIES